MTPKKPKPKRGRPRGARNRRTILREIAAETHVITDNGKRRRVSVGDMLFMQLRKLMLEGHPRARAEFERLIHKYAPQAMNDNNGILLVPESVTEAEILADMDKLNAEAEASHLARGRDELT